jgi:acyl-coenzyme A synthetase/AMP-(fatty) acid ligase
VVFVDDLPKTATGKLQRFKVRGLVAGEPDAQPDTPPVQEALEVTP